jgi:hypothetical protein
MKSKSLLICISICLCLFTLSSCAPSGDTSKEYGFFSGILHGFIFVFALIGKVFGGDHGLYAANNTGFFYWIGFLIGIGVIGGGGAASRR